MLLFMPLQGVFVKRHQVEKQDGGRFSPPDLAVGQTVTVYGRTFVLVDADTFTRNWWVRLQRHPRLSMGIDHLLLRLLACSIMISCNQSSSPDHIHE
jgi:hypothetical protein